MDLRELKGLEIAARMRGEYKDGAWLVPSQSSGGKYRVLLLPDGETCQCEDFQLQRKPCKHIHAARFVRERDRGHKAPALDADAVPKKPTYPQNWPVYNLAQRVEKHRFQVLLHDLCRNLEEPPPPKTGRRPHLVKDSTFSVAFKVYCGFSSRRFSCDLKDAHAKGFLVNPVPGMKVCPFFESEALTPVLRDLIVRSSLPLKAVETAFAPDSSGFSTSRFVKWFDEKYGVHRSEADWVKVHVMTGVKTNIITAVEIHGRDANDSPQFKPLVETTAQSFTVKEVSADKAYLSHGNLELVDKLGGTAFVPFKANSSSGEAGSVWERMFHFCHFKREEFLASYHKRSNVESTFSMVKAKFGDSIRSRTPAAMKNEALAKLLAHNLCVVIMSQCELGIEAPFWEDEPKTGPDVLPLVRPG